jgi:Protein of unknown function (DUF4054)
MTWGSGPSAGAVVIFSYSAFIAAYPQFGNVGMGQAQEFFNRACALLDNSCTSRLPYAPTATPPVFFRALILNAAVAHFAYLETPDAAGNVRPVGRISQAGEGSVNLSLEYAVPATDSAAFWNQTQFGAYLWIAVLPYRSARYAPGPSQNPYRGIGLGRGGFFVGRGRG